MWETVNEFTGRVKNPEEDHIGIKKWKYHCWNLLGQPPVISSKPTRTVSQHNLPTNTDNFTMEKLKKSNKNFKNNNTSGLDNILIEVWKTNALYVQLLEVCNKKTQSRNLAKKWNNTIPKKGRRWRRRKLSRTSVVAAKIYNKLLLGRIRSHLDPLLRINQNRFRPGSSTLAQIVTPRRFIEGIEVKQLPAVTIFGDFSKAFDSIYRKKLMEIPSAYGVQKEIEDTRNILYKDTVAQINTPDGETDYFEVTAAIYKGILLPHFSSLLR